MRVYARKTREDHIDVDTMTECVYQGIRFYEEFFGHPFPFNKYDYIFCPEYKFGAMENVGAITFAESFLFYKRTPTT